MAHFALPNRTPNVAVRWFCSQGTTKQIVIAFSKEYPMRLSGVRKTFLIAVAMSLLIVLTCTIVDVEQQNSGRVFKILCTSHRKVRRWGSYKIRCDEFKRLVEYCTNDVEVTLLGLHHLSFPENSSIYNVVGGIYDATISVKRPITPITQLGQVFVDIVDEYEIKSDDISPEVAVFVQNERHGRDRFADRRYHVIEHWFNSFPLDMLLGTESPVFKLPSIEQRSKLAMATIWSGGSQPCPMLLHNHTDIEYVCINKPYSIADWFKEYFQDSSLNELNRLNDLLNDPNHGPTGRIYFELFWKYDVLVVPAKVASPQKMMYGNVQRAVSQMRSGVPVLLEIRGQVLEDFMRTYNYSCSFDSTVSGARYGKYPSFDVAVRKMKSYETRRACQLEGVNIASDYSPTKIVSRELQIIGYEGHFNC